MIYTEIDEMSQIEATNRAAKRYYTQLRYDDNGPEDHSDDPICYQCKKPMSPLQDGMCHCTIEQDLWSLGRIDLHLRLLGVLDDYDEPWPYE